MNLVKLHRNYLLSRINIIIIGFVILMTVILSFILIKPFMSSLDKWSSSLVSIQNYEQNYIMFIKILMVLLSSYLFGIYFSNIGDNYSKLLICSISKSKYLISKIITILLTLFFIISLLAISHLLIGIIFHKWYFVSYSVIKQFGYIYLISISYGFLSIIFIRLFKSIYSVMLPFCIYLITEVFADYGINNNVVRIIGLFLPTTYLDNGNIVLLYGVIHLILINCFYFIISYLVYIKYKE